MSDDLQVRGGAAGSVARVEDMRTFASVADRVSEHLGDAAHQLTALTVSTEVASTAALSPVTAARAQTRAVEATGQLYASVALVKARATRLRLTADAIEAADVATSFGRALGTTGLGFLGLSAGLGDTVVTTPSRYATNLGAATGEAVGTGFDDGWHAFFSAMGDVPSEAGRRTGDELLGMWSGLLLDRPEMTNAVVDGLGTVASLLHDRLLSYPETVDSLLNVGGLFGWFDDSAAITVERADLGAITGDALESSVVPTSIADLLSNQQSIQELALGTDNGSRLRVIEVPGADGSSWIVQVPGTQEWGVESGGNPSDLTSNLHLSGPQEAALLDAIDAAMRDAGVGSDPVLIAGHSQGGIAAATFSTQAADRGYNVTHVITAGSPIAYTPVPEHIQVLAVEHHNDPVPRLDGAENPGAPNITTVGSAVGGSAVHDNPIQPHSSILYEETARSIDQSDNASVRSFIDSAHPFFSGPELEAERAIDSALIIDYEISRDQP